VIDLKMLIGSYNKRILRQIDHRVGYLRERLEELNMIDYSPKQHGKVFFSATVENDSGEQLSFKIVGPDEIFETKNCICIGSPVARTMLNINSRGLIMLKRQRIKGEK
jgi:transcription elongation factor GreB